MFGWNRRIEFGGRKKCVECALVESHDVRGVFRREAEPQKQNAGQFRTPAESTYDARCTTRDSRSNPNIFETTVHMRLSCPLHFSD